MFINKRLNINDRIFFIIILPMILTVIILSIILQIYFKNKIYSKYSHDINNNLTICSESINRLLTLYIFRSRSLVSNQNILFGIEGAYKNKYEDIFEFESILQIMSYDLKSEYLRIEPFEFYLSNYKNGSIGHINPIEYLVGEKPLDKIKKTSIEQVIWDNNLKKDTNGNLYISFYINLTSIFNEVVVMETNVPYIYYLKSFSKLSFPTDSIILNISQDNKIRFSSSRNIINNYNISNIKNKYFIFESDKLFDGSRIVILLPRKYFNNEYFKMLFINFILIIIFILLLILISKSTSRRITMELTQFVDYLKHHDNLLFNENILDIEGEDEISLIKKSFLKVIKKMNESYDELLKTKNQIMILETELLQSKINPHLLYNSLASIKWVALRQNDTKIGEIIDAMISYYRKALNKGNNIIKIDEELKMIEDYIKIINLAYSYNYKLIIDVDDNIRECYIIKHLLQPIAENAIMHGLNGKNDGYVKIKGYEINQFIILSVEDNGYGIECNKINEILSLNYHTIHGGYGIKNLINRIKLYYGSECGVEIKSEIGKGTEFIIKIMKKEKDYLENVVD